MLERLPRRSLSVRRTDAQCSVRPWKPPQQSQTARHVADRIVGNRHPGTAVALDTLIDAIAFDAQGLIAAIVQQHDTGDVLMLGRMNMQALRATLAGSRTAAAGSVVREQVRDHCPSTSAPRCTCAAFLNRLTHRSFSTFRSRGFGARSNWRVDRGAVATPDASMRVRHRQNDVPIAATKDEL